MIRSGEKNTALLTHRRPASRESSRESLREVMLTVASGSDEFTIPRSSQGSIVIVPGSSGSGKQKTSEGGTTDSAVKNKNGGARRSLKGTKKAAASEGRANGGKSCGGATRKSRKRAQSRQTALYAVVVLATAIISMAACYKLFDSYLNYREEQMRKAIRERELVPMSADLQAKLADAQKTTATLKQELAEALADAAALQQTSKELAERKQEQEQLAAQVDQLSAYRERMHSAIQQLSKHRLLETYGPGPHFVEIQLAFDPESRTNAGMEGSESSTTTEGNTILLEMAPADQMPHSVFWFLEQVRNGLFDGCSFHRNAGHVLQAGPVPNFRSELSGREMLERFRDAGLAGVFFQEYSAEFPHRPYTVGYAGRPGGPDFYISTRDNRLIHGPGGQDRYSDQTEADPCFAKVISGLEVVHRMQSADVKTDDGGYSSMQRPVAITSMRIVQRNQ